VANVNMTVSPQHQYNNPIGTTMDSFTLLTS